MPLHAMKVYLNRLKLDGIETQRAGPQPELTDSESLDLGRSGSTLARVGNLGDVPRLAIRLASLEYEVGDGHDPRDLLSVAASLAEERLQATVGGDG